MKLLILLILLVAEAHAESPHDAEAERFFRAGAKAYESGQYEAACRALEHAYALSPLPAIGFSMAQAYRLRYFADANPDHLRRAKQLYQAYLDQTPKGGRRHDAATALAEIDPLLSRLDPRASTVELLEQPTQLLITCQIDGAQVALDGGEELALPATVEVVPGSHHLVVSADGYFDQNKTSVAVEGRLIVEEIELEPRPALIRFSGDAGRAFVDGKPAGLVPLASPLEVPAGAHAITVVSNGSRRWDRSFEVEKGDALSFEVDLDTTGQRYLAWTVIGTAGLAAIAASALTFGAVRANHEARELDDLRAAIGIDEAQLEQYEGYLDDRRSFRNTAIGLFSSAAILGLTGALLYLFDEPDLTF